MRPDGRGRVLIFVQHLRGIGHVVRISRIAAEMAAEGLDVTMVMGGPVIEAFSPAGVRLVALPPLQAAPDTFRVLHTSEGVPPDETYKRRRFEILMGALEASRPQMVIVEAFPFDRPQMHFEFVPFIEIAAALSPRPLIVCSIRDILQRKDKPERDATAFDLLNQFFDHVFVHGDPRFSTLAETFPHTALLKPEIHDTGIVAPRPPITTSPPGAAHDVIVSHGGGAFGAHVLRSAIAAKPASRFAEARWLAISGINLPSSESDVIEALARANGVELRLFVSDLVDHLASAKVSVSQGGYNTVADILRSGCPAVICPDSGIRQNEQPMRAEKLAAAGRAVVVAERELTPAAIALAIDRAAAMKPSSKVIDLGGAQETARLAARLIKQVASRPS